MKNRPGYLFLLVSIGLSACAGMGDGGASACKRQLNAGYSALERAKAMGLNDAADVLRAAGLLAAATAERQFNEFPSCIDKAARAQQLLKPLL